MSKQIKEMIIADLRMRVEGCRDFVIVDSSRMDGVSANTMRLKLNGQNIEMLAVKNTLARKVFGEMGMSVDSTLLSGPSVLVWGGPDIVALSKEITKWAKDPNLAIKGGVVDGQAVNAEQLDAISKGPGREETIGRVLMLIMSPAAQLAGALLGPGGYLGGQVKALSEKEPEAEAAAAG